jgi:MFS family permease
MLRRPRIPLPLAGLLSLAVAMGIGRFAFTPMLPMMQADLGLTLSQGGWLASSNYLGYLAGALLGTRLAWSSEKMLAAGLWVVVLVTAAMGLGTSWPGWVLWRFLAGIASSWALIGTSALCVARLAASHQGEKTGVVFAGVGAGIAFAGLACMALTLLGAGSSQAWLWLGLAALAGLGGAATLWRAPACPVPGVEPSSAPLRAQAPDSGGCTGAWSGAMGSLASGTSCPRPSCRRRPGCWCPMPGCSVWPGRCSAWPRRFRPCWGAG